MTPAVPATVVVVDTDVFSHVFVQQRSTRRRELRDRLLGRIPVIATQTRAELLAWPRLRNWGADRSRRLVEIVESVPAVPVIDDVVDAYVTLHVECVRLGHGLGQKPHTGDRWIAATAVAIDRPLLTLDGIFSGAPGLTIL